MHICWTDGSVKFGPKGRVAYAACLVTSGDRLVGFKRCEVPKYFRGKHLRVDSNFAELFALYLGVETCLELDCKTVVIHTDYDGCLRLLQDGNFQEHHFTFFLKEYLAKSNLKLSANPIKSRTGFWGKEIHALAKHNRIPNLQPHELTHSR